MTKPSTIQYKINKWHSIESMDQLEAALKIPKHKIVLASSNPRYKSFQIPKKNGSYRLIEDP